MEGMEGYCWWSVKSAASKECGRGNGTCQKKRIRVVRCAVRMLNTVVWLCGCVAVWLWQVESCPNPAFLSTTPTGTFPNKAVTSCPWVGWQRGGGINGSTISFTVSWSLEGPHAVSQDHWSMDRYHHRFCFCNKDDSMHDCDTKCKTPPLPKRPASLGPEPTTHYTNPKKKAACRADEAVMKVGPGGAASICSPRCVKKGIFSGYR